MCFQWYDIILELINMTFAEELMSRQQRPTRVYLLSFSPFPTVASYLKVLDLSATVAFSPGVSIIELGVT